MYELQQDSAYKIRKQAEQWAQDRVQAATEFNISIIENYRSMYDKFWVPNEPLEVINAGLKRLGPIGLKMIVDAAGYAIALNQLLSDAFPQHLLAPPRTYTIKEIVFQDNTEVAELATFLELIGLTQLHGPWTAGYLEVGELIGN